MTLTYDPDIDRQIALRHEEESIVNQYDQPMIAGLHCGRRYTGDEVRAILRLGFGSAPTVNPGDDLERRRWRASVDDQVDKLLDRCVRTRYLQVNEDGTYSRKVATTTQWVYVDGVLTPVDPKDAPAIVAAEKDRLLAETPAEKTRRRIDALERELQALKN